MIEAIFYITWITNIILVSIKKRSKLIELGSLCSLIFLFGNNNQNDDYYLYYLSYTNSKSNSSWVGLNIFNSLCEALGLDYQGSRLLIEITAIIVVCILVYYLQGNMHMFIALYLFADQFINIVQMRTYFAALLLAISLVLKSKKKTLLAYLFAILSILFHPVAAFFLPFLIIYRERELTKNQIKNFIFIIFVIYISIFVINLAGGYVPFVSLIISWISNSIGMLGHASYYSDTTTRFGSLIYVILYMANMFGVISSKYVTYKGEVLQEYNENLDLIAVKANLYASICLPLIVMNMNFYRMYRILNIFNFIYFSYSIKRNYNNYTTIYLKQVIIYLSICTLWRIMYFTRIPEIFTNVYMYNSFIG